MAEKRMTGIGERKVNAGTGNPAAVMAVTWRPSHGIGSDGR